MAELIKKNLFTDNDALLLHQLRLVEWLSNSTRSTDGIAEAQPTRLDGHILVPSQWNLTQGIEPYPWQKECIRRWFDNKFSGTVKVVTGGGKTLLALAIIQQLQNTVQSELYVVIVVPTIVLMHQWHDELLSKGNIPEQAIGRLGGGHRDSIGGNCKILIAVLASASSQLPKMVKDSKIAKQLMLVVDECHRSGSKDMSRVFKASRAYNLGLSATPEREDDVDTGYDDSIVGKEVGRIIYEFNLIDALREGLVPKFTINHYGLPLSKDEKGKYEELSRSITDAVSKLRGKFQESRANSDFFSWARQLATRNKGDLGGTAMRFVSDTSKRRELLNRIESRHTAVETLLEREFGLNPTARVILFHESIDEVMSLFVRLRQMGLPAIAEHSELPSSVREDGLDLFRRGIAKIIVSARSLIEGFNVPAVDVGIIVASSGSVRQRIQSLGRVLRRHRGPDGEEKSSCIHVLYASETSEEGLYEKLDWDATTGVEQNRYFRWTPKLEPVQQDGPPRTPLPTESQIDRGKLEEGGVYPGRYDGVELSCDSQKNIKDGEGRHLLNAAGIAELVIKVKGSAGRFKVTPKKSYVLVRIPQKDEWETIFVTQLEQPLEFVASGKASASLSLDQADQWLKQSNPGDEYPFGELAIRESLKYKRKGGGVIARKVKDGEVYARLSDRAENAEKGKDAEMLLRALHDIHADGRQVTKIEVNELNDALFREEGKLLFLCRLTSGLEFPT